MPCPSRSVGSLLPEGCSRDPLVSLTNAFHNLLMHLILQPHNVPAISKIHHTIFFISVQWTLASAPTMTFSALKCGEVLFIFHTQFKYLLFKAELRSPIINHSLYWETHRTMEGFMIVHCGYLFKCVSSPTDINLARAEFCFVLLCISLGTWHAVHRLQM